MPDALDRRRAGAAELVVQDGFVHGRLSVAAVLDWERQRDVASVVEHRVPLVLRIGASRRIVRNSRGIRVIGEPLSELCPERGLFGGVVEVHESDQLGMRESELRDLFVLRDLVATDLAVEERTAHAEVRSLLPSDGDTAEHLNGCLHHLTSGA